MLKGSGRSIEGFHLRDALADIAAAEPDLMERFGGHAMAAGLSLPRAHLERFVAAFAARAQAALGSAPEVQPVETDGSLDAAMATLELAALLATAGPWGQGFPEPTFDDEFEVRGWRVMAERHLKLDLAWAACGTAVEAVHFGGYAGCACAWSTSSRSTNGAARGACGCWCATRCRPEQSSRTGAREGSARIVGCPSQAASPS